jgi:hypothetical protein
LKRELQKSFPKAMLPLELRDLKDPREPLILLAGLDACPIQPEPAPDWVPPSVESPVRCREVRLEQGLGPLRALALALPSGLFSDWDSAPPTQS